MKNLLQNKKTSGFTIIEVIIVLAIAGLIMVIVFIAIPQLQRNQRDNARQNVTNRVEAEMETFAGNNQGQYPFSSAALLTQFTTNYFNNLNRVNPRTGANYALAVQTAMTTQPTGAANANNIFVYPGGQCAGETATGTISTASRSVALIVQLDNGNTFYCVDNS